MACRVWIHADTTGATSSACTPMELGPYYSLINAQEKLGADLAKLLEDPFWSSPDVALRLSAMQQQPENLIGKKKWVQVEADWLQTTIDRAVAKARQAA